jgi:serine phosphatase RsbU (regulator of sigma subunit)/ligand-binding sensor domain-containing protein
MIRLLTILIGLLVFSQTFAQKFRFERITKNDGLSQSRVNVIAQDSLGFIWVGTDDGLNKVYASKIEVYRNQKNQGEQQLSGREISDLYVWNEDILIVACRDGDVDIWNEQSGEIKHIKLPEGIQPISLEKVGADLWIGTTEGVFSADLKTRKAEELSINESFPGWQVQDIVAYEDVVYIAGYGYGLVLTDLGLSSVDEWIPKDKGGHPLDARMRKPKKVVIANESVYVGYDGAYMIKKDLKSENFEWINADSEASFYGSKANAILVSSDGTLWVGSNDGLYNYSERKADFEGNYWIENNEKSLSSDHIRYLFQDKAGSIWVGTSDQGLSIYHPSLNQFEHIHKNNDELISLSANQVFQMLEDSKGDVWMATYGGGLIQTNFERGEQVIFGADSNRTHSNILSLAEWNGKVWFGSWGGGLNSFDLKTEEFAIPLTKEEGLPSNTIISLYTSNEKLFVGSFDGLYILDSAGFGKVYNSYSEGFEEGSFPSNVIYSIASYRDRVLLGTDGGGLIILNPNDSTTLVLDENSEPAISSNSVLDIKVEKDAIWLATSAGLDKLSFDFTNVESWNSTHGLPSDYINALVFNNDYVWLSTNNGIYNFNPSSNEKGRAYFVEDGIQGNEFNQASVLKLSSGEILFGGTNGITKFNPKQLEKNKYNGPIVLTKVKLFAEELSTKKKPEFIKSLTLDYNQNFLSFEFTGLNYVLPQNNRFQYKLEGLDQEWSEISDRNFISYSDLKSGEYTLLVRMYNNDGVLSNKILRIQITINPPFWETWWFKLISILLIILAAYGFYRWRMRAIRKEKELLEEKVELRTAELKERTNELAEKNQDIMDSIEYAKKIQSAILPNEELLNSKWEDYFVFFLPKDVVSGDFYWFGERGSWKIITAADCTGHGVPGALMSMIGANLLHKIVDEKGEYDPGKILTELNVGVQKALKQGTGAQETNDGMDISLCAYNEDEAKLIWAGAYNPLFLIRDGELIKYKANKYPIGGSHMEMDRVYDSHVIDVKSGDRIYMFSDGFPDQFGGPKMKKYMGKRFQKFLLDIHNKPMPEQKQLILNEFKSWKGDLEQIDDVCIVGVRF